jgi:hypothetical protein
MKKVDTAGYAAAVQADYDFDVSGITEANAQEMKQIKSAAVASGTFMKAPNGEGSKLSERQWLQVRTAVFKEWFGDWESAALIRTNPTSETTQADAKLRQVIETAKSLRESAVNSSKVVDENGEPLPVYHGTNQEFTKFSKKRIGKNTSAKSSIAFFFTENRDEAQEYADLSAKHQVTNAPSVERKLKGLQKKISDAERIGNWDLSEKLYLDLEDLELGAAREGAIGQKIIEVFLNIRSANTVGLNDSFNGYEVGAEITQSKKENRDGVHLVNVYDPVGERTSAFSTNQWVALDPSQIKSAAGNNGNFDEKSDDIRFQLIGERGATNLDKAEEDSTRMDNLSIAREMEAAGKEAKAIKFATSWERGADGKWRYEVADVRVDASKIDKEDGEFYGKLKDVLHNDELFKAYPSLQDVKIDISPRPLFGFPFNGRYRKNVNRLDVYYNTKFTDDGNFPGFNDAILKEINAITAHEIQHFIQSEEGFASGATPGLYEEYKQNHPPSDFDLALRDLVAKKPARSRGNLYDYLERINPNKIKSAELKDLLKRYQGGDVSRDEMVGIVFKNHGEVKKWENLPQDMYHRTAGEVEARNASRRMDMTPEERRASLAAETEDVSRKDQLFAPITREESEALTGLLLKSGLAKNVVYGAEALAEATEAARADGVRQLRTRDGEVYGAVKGGVVYLDDAKLNANTPLHEFGHLWNDFIKKHNPELWEKGKALIKNTPYWDKVSRHPAYSALPAAAKADEALAMAIGDRGEALARSGNVLGATRLRTWLSDAWRWVGGRLGIRNLSARQVERLTLDKLVSGAVADLLSGKKISPSQRQERIGIPTKIGEVALTAEQHEKLAGGGAIRMSGLTDRFGKKYPSDVQVRWDFSKSSVALSKPTKQAPQQQRRVPVRGVKI